MAVQATEFDILKPGDVIAKKYVCEEIIGRGGFADVYRVLDPQGRRFALKTLRAARVDDAVAQSRMAGEIAILCTLHHPNIVAYVECGVYREVHLYVVTELLNGKTLREYIALRGSLPVEEALRYAIQVGHALIKAHELGIVHRDVKPENVMVLPSGVVKLLDFGIARHVDLPGATTRPVGTVFYMAPDQAENVDPAFIDRRWDVFALALILWEMVAGYHPRRGPENKDIAQATMFKMLLQEPMPVLSDCADCPAWLSRVIMTGLATDPAERWQTMAAFVRALEESLERHFQSAKPLAAALPPQLASAITEAIAAMAPDKHRGGTLRPVASRPPVAAAPTAAPLAEATHPQAPAIAPAASQGTDPVTSPVATAIAAPTAAPGARGPGGTVRMPLEDAVDGVALAAARARRDARLEARQPPERGQTEPMRAEEARAETADDLPDGVPRPLGWRRLSPYFAFKRDELTLLGLVFVIAMGARELWVRFL